jgi:chemotaxis protein methyltransferase CheR
MTPAFQKLARFLRRECGIVLDDDKQYFAEMRLLPIARRHGKATVEQVLELLDTAGSETLTREVVDAMTTNETFFFRDRAPFDLFRDVMLPHLLSARGAERHIRIWCAACSTGQEPYSLAMILDEEARRLPGWRIDIVASDISHSVIENAREGFYNQFEVQRGLPVGMLLRYFTRENNRWRVAEHLRSHVQFREWNLLSDFSSLGFFDVIFCRNVLLYFEHATRRDVLARLAATARPDGFLVLGAAETVVGTGEAWVAREDHPNLFVRREVQPQRLPACGLAQAS